jgi:HEAT repeat protein
LRCVTIRARIAITLLQSDIAEGSPVNEQHSTDSDLGNIADLIRDLKYPDRFVRREAALALGKMKAHQAVGPLIDLLDDHETVWDAAQDAAWALGEIGDQEAVEPLIAVLDQPNVAGPAVEALAKLADPRMVEPLIRLLKEKRIPSIATILGNFGDRRAVEPLIDALHVRDSSLRFYATRALGKLGDERALPALEWARDHDTQPILDRKSIRGKSVSDAAIKAIEWIKAASAE